MAAKPDRQRFSIELRDEGTADDTPAIIRLRRALKCLLRSFAFRCVEILEIHGAVSPSTVSPDADQGEADAETTAVSEPGEPS